MAVARFKAGSKVKRRLKTVFRVFRRRFVLDGWLIDWKLLSPYPAQVRRKPCFKALKHKFICSNVLHDFWLIHLLRHKKQAAEKIGGLLNIITIESPVRDFIDARYSMRFTLGQK
ncbi:hypothetical protein NEISICOT_03617 [Neisseria sicca ATCC 29256]|uniref:Uncharacterized protein n=1 Tax=Neisseria sicca ATCC 29256 TaxID=547045 RepID=C6MAP5_NEISI|nr:hypothetical protein NEISICOT_03617 [Neisseria sicca ATCC 29256]